MMDFNKLKYERVDYDKTKTKIEELITQLTKTNDFKTYIAIVEEINTIQNHIEEMFDYADIQNMRDLQDTYYKEEIEYWNEFKPKFDVLFLPFYKEIQHSKFKELIGQKMPPNFFEIINMQSKITSDKNTELLKKENELKINYRNLNKTKILYDGKETTIGDISSLFSHKNRTIRKQAHDAVNDFYYAHKEEYIHILYELIQIRNQIANNLGFKNYVEYSLYKHKRIGYDYQDIREFRTNIIDFIIPLCKEIGVWHKEELGLTKLEYYDTVYFEDMPKLKLFDTDLLRQFEKYVQEVDQELANLFQTMLSLHYIDLENRENKVNFAITNYLTETKMPVVTGNYKKTYLDIQTTTHELGHAYQKYCASIKDKEYIVSPLLKYPTMEVAEMFSYSMELIMMNHVADFFSKEDYNKYCFIKIYNMVINLPYICLVDEFQQIIYSKEDVKVEDINNVWLTLVDKYHVEKSNQGHINLEDGGFYYRQSHIYLDPFYYIDYALSYFGTFSIWNKCASNIEFFKELGSIASYYSFHDLIDKYHMPNPFFKDTVKDIALRLETELQKRKKEK